MIRRLRARLAAWIAPPRRPEAAFPPADREVGLKLLLGSTLTLQAVGSLCPDERSALLAAIEAQSEVGRSHPGFGPEVLRSFGDALLAAGRALHAQYPLPAEATP